ncbi:MAG TPA: hypothetical protein VG738_09205 [Chitinophagaceae bacterium]|nr:hypothetical protein [Chitinophagaceae bacterium]
MKNNLKHYTHSADSYNQWQFKVLRRTYGWDGQGKYWVLCDMMAKEENCTLACNDEDKLLSFAVELDFEPGELLEFLRFLLNNCRLIIETTGGYTTKGLQQALAVASKVRTYDRLRKLKTRNKTTDEGYVKVDTAGTNDDSIPEAPDLTLKNEHNKIKENKRNKREERERVRVAKPIVLSSTPPHPLFFDKNKTANCGNGAFTRKQRLNAQQRHVARANKHGPGQFSPPGTLLTNTC